MLDHLVELCNGVTSKLIGLILNEDRDSLEAQVLLNLSLQDYLTTLEQNIVEFPIGIILIKSLMFQVINLLQVD